MRNILSLMAFTMAFTSDAQITPSAAKMAIIPSAFAIQMRNVRSSVNTFYSFGDTLTTIGGRYVTPFINIQYFHLTDTATKYTWNGTSVIATPSLSTDSFRIPASVVTHTP